MNKKNTDIEVIVPTTPDQGKNWEERYAGMKDWPISEWSVSFVAKVLTFSRTQPIGKNASHLTKELRERIDAELASQASRLREEMENCLKSAWGEIAVELDQDVDGFERQLSLSEENIYFRLKEAAISAFDKAVKEGNNKN